MAVLPIDELKKKIDSNIYQNSQQAITGARMNTILNDMVDSLDETETLDALSKDLVSAAQGVQTNAENITANAEAIATNKTETDAKLTELEQEVIYDVTANNNGATFTSLSALLSDENLFTLIPFSENKTFDKVRFLKNTTYMHINKKPVPQINNGQQIVNHITPTITNIKEKQDINGQHNNNSNLCFQKPTSILTPINLT
jgi:hypothetical protein